MLLEIDDWRSVNDLQYRFNKCFSNLHLQVFDATSKDETEASGNTLVSQIRKTHEPGVLNIKSWHTAAAITNKLRLEFGIHARIVLLEGTRQKWQLAYEAMPLQNLNKMGQVQLRPRLI